MTAPSAVAAIAIKPNKASATPLSHAMAVIWPPWQGDGLNLFQSLRIADVLQELMVSGF
jgi:hypothetical protein